MKKYFIAVIIIAALASFGFTEKFNFEDPEPTSFLSFNGKSVENINFDNYDFKTAFHVLDAVNSNDCDRIESTSEYYADDEKLYDWITFKSDICFYQKDHDPTFKENKILNIETGPFIPEEFYKDMLNFYPEGTKFDNNIPEYA
jgi:hypothetical protein